MKLYKYIVVLTILSILTLNAKDLRIEAKELSSTLKNYIVLDARSYLSNQ